MDVSRWSLTAALPLRTGVGCARCQALGVALTRSRGGRHADLLAAGCFCHGLWSTTSLLLRTWLLVAILGSRDGLKVWIT